MKKRVSSLDSTQLGFTFEAPAPASGDAALAGLDRFMSAAVARALKEDTRSRDVIAAEVSALLGEQVTRFMLDAYAAESRQDHNVPAHRFYALIAVTNRFDLLDATLRRIGAAVLVGEEIQTARLGHLKAQLARISAEIKAVERTVQPIDRGSIE